MLGGQQQSIVTADMERGLMGGCQIMTGDGERLGVGRPVGERLMAVGDMFFPAAVSPSSEHTPKCTPTRSCCLWTLSVFL